MGRRKTSKNKGKYKSLFEKQIAERFEALNLKVGYEADTFDYVRPSSYTPDWKLAKGVYIESKGYFAPADRRNLLAFKSQYPEIKILILFANKSNKLHRKAKMTYEEWCLRHDFECADFKKEGIPEAWLKYIKTKNGTEKTS